jgi:predicted RND superfamily exporter protein
MFVTSSTTCVCFLANVFSNIMPIKAFGIFAAIIIPVNFILVAWVFPSLLIFKEYYINPCCRRKNKMDSNKIRNTGGMEGGQEEKIVDLGDPDEDMEANEPKGGDTTAV